MDSVLFLSLMNGEPWGGSEEGWYISAQWLLKHNYRVGVATYDWEERMNKLQSLKEINCEIYLLPNRLKTKHLFGKLILQHALKKIPFHQYKFVFVNQGGWKEVVHEPYKTLHKKLANYILSFHNYNADSTLSANKVKSLHTWINNARLNISDSKKVYDILQKNFNIPVPNQKVFYNPITFKPPLQLQPYPLLENGNYVWVMLAALDIERKAQDELIKVLSTNKWKQRNWILKLYGKGRDYKKLQNLIQSCNMQQQIFLCGHSDNVQQVLSKSHLLFQCTHIDAMPISVVEAMAMARPCFVSNIGDMSLWVKHDENGFICERAEKTFMDKCLEECWQKKDRWELMGKNAFATFRAKYPEPYAETFIKETIFPYL